MIREHTSIYRSTGSKPDGNASVVQSTLLSSFEIQRFIFEGVLTRSLPLWYLGGPRMAGSMPAVIVTWLVVPWRYVCAHI